MHAMRATQLNIFFIATAVARAAFADGQCEVALEGALSGSAKSPMSRGAVATDYWMTTEEQRRAVEIMASIGTKDPAEKQKKVDAAMAKEPHFRLLILNCVTDVARLTFMATDASTYKDIPFGPGKLRLGPALNKTKGQVGTIVAIKTDAGHWQVQGEGELDIQAWDVKHIAGTAKVPLTSDGKQATLKATFDFPCKSFGKCEK